MLHPFQLFFEVTQECFLGIFQKYLLLLSTLLSTIFYIYSQDI